MDTQYCREFVDFRESLCVSASAALTALVLVLAVQRLASEIVQDGLVQRVHTRDAQIQLVEVVITSSVNLAGGAHRAVPLLARDEVVQRGAIVVQSGQMQRLDLGEEQLVELLWVLLLSAVQTQELCI